MTRLGRCGQTIVRDARRKNSWLLLTALVSIVKGNSSIVANKEGGDYSKRLKISLQQYKIPMKEYLQIEQSQTPNKMM